MRPPTSPGQVVDEAGQWQIIAKAPGYAPLDVSWFRDAPTQLGALRRADPFGPVGTELVFPAVTLFDQLGRNELYWIANGVDFDIEWIGALPAGYPLDRYVWEGYAESFNYSNAGVQITLKGALLEKDDPLAKPEYPPAPLPYEHAIARHFNGRHNQRVGPLKVEWPTWWDTIYTPDPTLAAYRTPVGVTSGDKWSGLVTRRTGSWEPVLSSYIQTLLTGMYTYRGRFTLDLDPGRNPVLRHRDYKYEPDSATIVIDAGSPGLAPDLNEDWSQSIGVVYGQGTSLQGVGFSGMQITGDGSQTVYKPLAALRQLEPVTDENGWLEPERRRKEVLLQMPDGIDEAGGRRVGLNHLQHFAEPGLQGTLTLSEDPVLSGGEVLPRALILEGMTVQLKGAYDREEGILLHVVSVNADLKAGTTVLTVDSKYRDALTLEEVQLRGRDALNVTRQLIGGLYEPPIPDQLVPWNYAEGSGYIPSSEKLSAQRLFEDMPTDIEFPWTEWTTQRPPRSAAFKDCYVKIGPADAVNSNVNWAKNPGRDSSAGAGYGYAFPVRMAQQGQIRLLQLAAYDADGNVLDVPFHFSLYYSPGTSVQAMPRIPEDQSDFWGPGATVQGAGPGGFAVTTDTLQHYPFFNGAWERFNADGTSKSIANTVATESTGLARGWGTGSAKAGYWPGSSSDPAALPTGLLVDERTWEFDAQTDPNAVNFIDPRTTVQTSASAGFLYGMIYCDAQGDAPVYFAGRMFRVEPGSSV